MDWFAINLAELNSPRFQTLSNDLLAVWLRLAVASANQGAGGVLVGARHYSTTQWLRLGRCAPTAPLRLIRCEVAAWRGSDLVLTGYDATGEDRLRRRSALARQAASARWTPGRRGVKPSESHAGVDADAYARADANRDASAMPVHAGGGNTTDRPTDRPTDTHQPAGARVRARDEDVGDGEDQVAKIAAAVVSKLNRDLKAEFAVDETLVEHIDVLLARRWSEKDMRAVIWHRVTLWGKRDDMRDNLRPSVLFSPRKFGEYAAAARTAYDAQNGEGAFERWHPGEKPPPLARRNGAPVTVSAALSTVLANLPAKETDDAG